MAPTWAGPGLFFFGGGASLTPNEMLEFVNTVHVNTFFVMSTWLFSKTYDYSFFFVKESSPK